MADELDALVALELLEVVEDCAVKGAEVSLKS